MAVSVPGSVAELLRRSTVQIRSGRGSRQGSGTGVVIGSDQVITNAHVVQSRDLAIENWEGALVPATPAKIDRRADLALLAAPGLKGHPATLGDSARVRPGDPVVAVGNPLGFTGALSSGTIRRVGRMPIFDAPSDWICSDVRLAPGNSGGPLADLRGEVVGINTLIAAGGLAFAISSRAVQKFLSGAGSQQGLGVTARPLRLSNGTNGMLILELLPGGAAEAASLLPGDILIAANQVGFRNFYDLLETIQQSAGAPLRLSFYRGRQDLLRNVTARIPSDQTLKVA